MQRLALLSSCVRREGETLGRIAGSAPPLLLESSSRRSCTTTARPTRRLEATNLVQDEKKAIALRLEDLPSNPHALTTEELQACLVAWGFPMTRVPSSRPELLNLIENAREERKLDLPLLLTHVPNRSKEAESESEGAQESSGSEASPSRKRVRRGKAKQAEPRQQLKRRKTLADQVRRGGDEGDSRLLNYRVLIFSIIVFISFCASGPASRVTEKILFSILTNPTTQNGCYNPIVL